MTFAITQDQDIFGLTLLPLTGWRPLAESLDGDGGERQPATIHVVSPPESSARSKARESETLDSILLPSSQPRVPVNSIERILGSRVTQRGESIQEEARAAGPVEPAVGITHAFGEVRLQESFSAHADQGIYDSGIPQDYAPSSGAYSSFPLVESFFPRVELLHKPVYPTQQGSRARDRASKVSPSRYRTTVLDYQHASRPIGRPRSVTEPCYVQRKGQTLQGIVAAIEEKAVEEQYLHSDLAVYAKDSQTGEYEKVTRKAGTFYAVLDAMLREAGLTPEYEMMTYTDSETGRQEKGFILSGVKEHDRTASRMLHAPAQKIGLLGFINGEEPGKGTVSLDDYLMKPGDRVSVAYVFQGLYKGDFGKERSGCL